MVNNIFRFFIPIFVFTILLLDARNNMKIYRRNRRDIKKFEVASVFLIISLAISIIIGLLKFTNREINEMINYIIVSYNMLVLIIYIIFTRFKSFRRRVGRKQ